MTNKLAQALERHRQVQAELERLLNAVARALPMPQTAAAR